MKMWKNLLLLGMLVVAFGTPQRTDAMEYPIAPGDILFTEFFDGWHKLDPVTGVVTQLPWPDSSVFTTTLQFDLNGGVLYDISSEIYRLNPATGGSVDLQVPGISLLRGFVVDNAGDLLIGNTGEVSRYSRATKQTTTVTEGDFFAPAGIARGADGRVFITEFFEDLWEIDPVGPGRSTVTADDLSIPGLIAVRSDGDLIIENFTPNELYRVDPDTGAVSLFSADLPTFVNGFALDASDNLWVTATDGIYRYDAAGGPKTLVYDETFFNPSAIVVVPASFALATIPEPTAALLAAPALAAFAWRRRRPPGAQC